MNALPKLKANQVYEAIEKAGLSPDDFHWDDDGDDTRLRHRPSVAYFVFGGNASKYVVRYAAGDQPVWKLEKHSWQAVMTSVESWLWDVKRDADTPDLWAELRGRTQLLDGVWDEAFDNRRFTPDEQGEIAKQLSEFREYVQSAHPPSEQQLADLDAKLDYLVDAATRLGRKDWLIIFVGAIVAWLVASALQSDAAGQIFEALMSGIAQLLGPGLYLAGG